MKRVLVSLLVLIPALAFAEIYECDGKWTNKPCSGSVDRSMHEVVESSELTIENGQFVDKKSMPVDNSVPSEPMAPRYSLARKLKKLSKETMEKSQVSLTKEELRLVEEQCTKRETTMAECQALYDRNVQMLNARVEANKKPPGSY